MTVKQLTFRFLYECRYLVYFFEIVSEYLNVGMLVRVVLSIFAPNKLHIL